MLTGPVPGAVALSLETPPLPHEASAADARASATRLANRRHAPKALRITASPWFVFFLAPRHGARAMRGFYSKPPRRRRAAEHVFWWHLYCSAARPALPCSGFARFPPLPPRETQRPRAAPDLRPNP